MLYFISIQIHFLVVMKGFRTLLCVISLALSGVIVSDVMAQKELGVFNSLAVGVGVGTTGIDVNVATPITSHFDLRGGFSIMPNFSMSTDVDVEDKILVMNTARFTYLKNQLFLIDIFSELKKMDDRFELV